MEFFKSALSPLMGSGNSLQDTLVRARHSEYPCICMMTDWHILSRSWSSSEELSKQLGEHPFLHGVVSSIVRRGRIRTRRSR